MASIIADHQATRLVNDSHARKLAVLEELHRLIFVEAGVEGVFNDSRDKTAEFVRRLATPAR